MSRPTPRPVSKGPGSFGAGHRKAAGPRRARGGGDARPTLLLLLVLLFGVRVSIQQHDPVSNFCRRFGHQAAIIDDRLYIDGGYVNYNPLDEFPTNYTNEYLLFHDISSVAGSGMPQLYSNLSKNHTIPSPHGAVLWPDPINKRLYQFGGEFADDKPPPLKGVHAYDVLSDTWDHFSFPDADRIAVRRTGYGAGVAIPERGEGYWYGGWLSDASEEDGGAERAATSYMVKYEMDRNSWTNTSGPDDIGRAEGAMVYIPAGDAGMLVYVGGVKDEGRNGSAEAQPMDEVLVYDVLSFKWYTQKASGDVPDSRSLFCAGVTWAEDRSSYNIYLYGGTSTSRSTPGFDDVYILSLPSFTWIKFYPPGTGTAEFPHHSLTCTISPTLSQMLIVGGTFPLTDMCDTPEQWGSHNLDLGRQNPDRAVWMLYDPEKEGYLVPSDVTDVIGGKGEGGATKTVPEGGFDSPDLEILLARTASSSVREPTREIPGGDADDGLSGGQIAGIVVGSVAGLLLILLAATCLIRRRRHRPPPPPPRDPNTPEMATSESRGYVLPAPTQTDPIELAAGPAPEPTTYTPTPDSEHAKVKWGGPGAEDGAHELSATPGTGVGERAGRVHATYYHA